MDKKSLQSVFLLAVAAQAAVVLAPGCGSSPNKRAVPTQHPGDAGEAGETSSEAGHSGKSGGGAGPVQSGGAGPIQSEAGEAGMLDAGASGASGAGGDMTAGAGGVPVAGGKLDDACSATDACEPGLNCLGTACSCVNALSGHYMVRTDGIAYLTLVNDTSQSLIFNADTALALRGIVSISGSNYHGCAALDTGEVRCWLLDASFTNAQGQLGNGTASTPGGITTALSATLVKTDANTSLSNVVSVGDNASTYGAAPTTCAVTKDKKLFCWGGGTPKLIDEATTPTLFATQIRVAAAGAYITGVTQVSVGQSHACLLLDTGKVRCWGLGDPLPVPLYPSNDFTVPGTVTKVRAAYNSTCALNSAGAVYCWGNGASLGIGPNVFTASGSPNRVLIGPSTFLDNITDFSMAYQGTCALRSDHTIWCWGDASGYAVQVKQDGVNVTDAVLLGTPGSYAQPKWVTESGQEYFQTHLLKPNCSIQQ